MITKDYNEKVGGELYTDKPSCYDENEKQAKYWEALYYSVSS